MARGASQDEYGAMGSVPQRPDSPVALTGTGAGPMNIHANAEEFGGAIAQGVEKVGNTAEDLAVKYGNMVNESQATDAEVKLATRIGQINSDYHTKTGQAAYDAYPAYQAAIQQAQVDSRQGLTVGAQQAFDLTSRRLVANHIADGSAYAATQLKDWHVESQSSLADVHIQQILDPAVAMSQERTGYNIGTAIHAEQAKMDIDHPGLKTDPETGNVSFDESKPEGQQLKQQYNQRVDAIISQGKINQYTTLAKPDVMGVLPAYDLYKKERDSLPPQAQVALDSTFAPKVFNAHKDNVTGATLADAAQAHAELLYNPQSLSVRNNNPGNLRDPSTGQFRVFDSPEAGQTAMEADLAAKISGNSPAMERNFGKGYSPTLANVISTWAPSSDNNDPKAYANTVSKETGISPDQVLTKADIAKLIPAMAKVEAGGSSGNITTAQTEPAAYTTTQKAPYGVNANGAPLTLADYYRMHSQDVYAKGEAYAEQTMPGDLAFRRAVHQTLQNQMSTTIANENQMHAADNRGLVRAINGEMTKGQPPETEQQLRAIPGMSDLLDKVSAQDPKFAEGIPTMIAKMSRRNETTNSSNGYETLMRALEPHGEAHPNRIHGQDQLDHLLGRSDGTGINMKDYKDVKAVIETDNTFKETLAKHLQEITNANGNVDGKGQERALQWYGQVMAAKKQNDLLGDKKLSDAEFISRVGEKDGPPEPEPPSRMQQISNWVASFKKPAAQPEFNYDAILKGQTYTAPDGSLRTKQ